MTNVEGLLKNLGINTSSMSTVITGVREFVEGKGEDFQIQNAELFFYEVFGIRVTFDDRFIARLTAQYAIAIVQPTFYELGNAPKMFEAALNKANEFKNKPTNGWMFATADDVDSPVTLDTPVAKKPRTINATDKVEQLYFKHVRDAEKPLTSPQFKEIVRIELGMTTSGARTYAWTVFNKFKAERTAKAVA